MRHWPLLLHGGVLRRILTRNLGEVDEEAFRKTVLRLVVQVSTVNPIYAGLRDADAILSQVPMGRFATPQEIAASVRFLLSDQAAAVTGTTLVVDCGWLAGSGWQTYQPMPRR